MNYMALTRCRAILNALNMARQRNHAKVTGSPKMTGSTCDSSPSFAFAFQRGQHRTQTISNDTVEAQRPNQI